MKRVLVAHAHNMFRQSLAIVLDGHTSFSAIIPAESLAEASRVLPNLDGKVDLAIISLEISDGDASALIEKLHANGVLTLALAIESDQERRAQALQAGANEVLSMSSSCEYLIEAASRLVQR